MHSTVSALFAGCQNLPNILITFKLFMKSAAYMLVCSASIFNHNGRENIQGIKDVDILLTNTYFFFCSEIKFCKSDSYPICIRRIVQEVPYFLWGPTQTRINKMYVTLRIITVAVSTRSVQYQNQKYELHKVMIKSNFQRLNKNISVQCRRMFHCSSWIPNTHKKINWMHVFIEMSISH